LTYYKKYNKIEGVIKYPSIFIYIDIVLRYLLFYMEINFMQFRVLDLFCGAGGFSYGFDKNSNFTTVLGLDFDADAINTFNYNIKTAKGIVGDITDISVRDSIITQAKELGVNMVIGGPPCQGFSLKGKNLGLEDPRNFLFLEYIKIVEVIRPEVFVIENVKNLINAIGGYFIKQIVDKFVALGYIVNFGVVNAKNFGIPQNRERAVIIGSLTRSIMLPKDLDVITPTIKDAISDLSYLESGQGRENDEYKNAPRSDYQRMLRGSKLYNHKSTNHSEIAINKLKMIPPEGDKTAIPKELHGKQKFATTWARLKWNDISPTIDTRFDTPSNGRNSHPYLNRAITPREAARIQSFDDNFVFIGGKTAICRQIGNAVPPLLAKNIAETISKAYNDYTIVGKDYKIYLRDAFAIVKEFQKENLKVDHIITDPPYNISKNNNFTTMSSPRNGIDFGQWDKEFDLYGWIADYVKLLDNNGSIIIFCSYLYISYLVQELEKNNIIVKDVLVWQKSNPMPRNIERRYVQDMEFAIWGVVKNSKWVFNKPKDKPYLRSIFSTSVVNGNEKNGHPTQKSLVLMDKIIKVHTNKGDTILDPFMGSGTTGVAAKNLGRKFIGVEKNDEFYNIANKRLQNI